MKCKHFFFQFDLVGGESKSFEEKIGRQGITGLYLYHGVTWEVLTRLTIHVFSQQYIIKMNRHVMMTTKAQA